MTAPNWSKIFKRFPELEAPGYQEALRQMQERRPDYEAERLKAKMQLINKEKQRMRTKNRHIATARSLVAADNANSLFSANKGRRKKG
jgi:hypothetical protein